MQFRKSKFELYKQNDPKTSWANYTMENHLAYNAYIKPTKLGEDAMQFVCTTKSLSRNLTPLTDMTKGKGKVKMIDTSEWEWKLYGIGYRPAIVLEDYEVDNLFLGKGQSKFKIKLDCDYFRVGDILIPRGPKQFQVRVQEEPYADGDGTVYTVSLITDDHNFFLPKQFTRPGEQWKKIGTSYSEARIGAGSTSSGDMPHFVMRSWLTKMAKSYRITGDAAAAKLVVKPYLEVEGGKYQQASSDMWFTVQEAIAEREWKQEKEMMAMYSRSTRSLIDEQTGLPVKQGPGLQELLEEGNIQYYNKFSINLVKDFLRDIFFDRIEFKNRNIYMLTGQIGLELFDEAVKDIVNGSFSDQATYYIDDNGNKMDRSQGGSLGYGNYYKVYNMMWGKLIPIHFPAYDNRDFHTEINPATGYPVESQRFTFVDLGFGDGLGGDNLYWIEKNKGEKFGYTCGTYGPYGPTNGLNMPMSHSNDWFEVIRESSQGVQLTDPHKTGELIFNLQY